MDDLANKKLCQAIQFYICKRDLTDEEIEFLKFHLKRFVMAECDSLYEELLIEKGVINGIK